MKDTKGAQELRKLVSPPRRSQKEIADKCGVTQQAVSSWMTHRAQPTPDRMRVLQDEFGIPMEAWTDEPAEASPDEEAPASEPTPTGEAKAAS